MNTARGPCGDAAKRMRESSHQSMQPHPLPPAKVRFWLLLSYLLGQLRHCMHFLCRCFNRMTKSGNMPKSCTAQIRQSSTWMEKVCGFPFFSHSRDDN
mmetsp:Transcript_100/g.190  ORF Transcript_100/g.190 Transcript_100/m.190 type:complete len:98 (-) Transcript_100:63-356(-)